MSFIVLLYTGLGLYFPLLAVPLGGVRMAITVYRAAGILFLLSPLAFLVLFPRRSAKFLGNYGAWSRADLKWLILFPLYLLLPSVIKLPEVPEKINPGQKLDGGLLLLFALLNFPFLPPHLSKSTRPPRQDQRR